MQTDEKANPSEGDEIACYIEVAPGVRIARKRKHLNPSIENIRAALFSEEFAEMIGQLARHLAKKRKANIPEKTLETVS